MAGWMSFDMKGTKEMRQRAVEMKANQRRAMLRAVDKFDRQELSESQKRVPVDTGELRDSGFTVPAYFEGDQVRGGVGYGADHAMVVHEDLEAHHRVGQAKYLESVINESAPYFSERVAESMHEDMKK